MRSGDRHEWETARRQTAWSSTELSLPATVRERIGRLPLYVSVDIDVLDPSGGVSHVPVQQIVPAAGVVRDDAQPYPITGWLEAYWATPIG